MRAKLITTLKEIFIPQNIIFILGIVGMLILMAVREWGTAIAVILRAAAIALLIIAPLTILLALVTLIVTLLGMM
jgi:hypothetical protein